jgi:hypothetical protein
MTKTDPASVQSAIADELLESMCRRYASAVKAIDSAA